MKRVIIIFFSIFCFVCVLDKKNCGILGKILFKERKFLQGVIKNIIAVLEVIIDSIVKLIIYFNSLHIIDVINLYGNRDCYKKNNITTIEASKNIFDCKYRYKLCNKQKLSF